MRKRSILKCSRETRAGFSLIELLFSMAILMLLVLGATRMLLLSLQTGVRCREGAAALEMACLRIEGLKAAPFDSPELSPGQSLVTVRGPRGISRFSVSRSIRDSAEGLKVIEIQCTPRNNPIKSVRLGVFKSRDLGF